MDYQGSGELPVNNCTNDHELGGNGVKVAYGVNIHIIIHLLAGRTASIAQGMSILDLMQRSANVLVSTLWRGVSPI